MPGNGTQDVPLQGDKIDFIYISIHIFVCSSLCVLIEISKGDWLELEFRIRSFSKQETYNVI